MLALEPGAVFAGAVAANPAVDDQLLLTGKSAGQLDGLGTQFTGFTSLQETIGAIWTLSGSVSMSFLNGGTVQGGAASLALNGSVTNNGTITSAGGAVSIAQKVMGVGTLIPAPAGTLTLLDGAVDGQTVQFLP